MPLLVKGLLHKHVSFLLLATYASNPSTSEVETGHYLEVLGACARM